MPIYANDIICLCVQCLAYKNQNISMVNKVPTGFPVALYPWLSSEMATHSRNENTVGYMRF